MTAPKQSQKLVIPGVKTFQTEDPNPPTYGKPTTTTTNHKKFTDEERKAILEQAVKEGYGRGAVVGKIENGVPRIEPHQWGMVVWHFSHQIEGIEYKPLEVRWLGHGDGNCVREKFWPEELFIVSSAPDMDLVRTQALLYAKGVSAV